MIGYFNCWITGVQLQPTVELHCPIITTTKWLVKNEAANAPIIFEEFVMVMINAGSTEQGCYNSNNNNNNNNNKMPCYSKMYKNLLQKNY